LGVLEVAGPARSPLDLRPSAAAGRHPPPGAERPHENRLYLALVDGRVGAPGLIASEERPRIPGLERAVVRYAYSKTRHDEPFTFDEGWWGEPADRQLQLVGFVVIPDVRAEHECGSRVR